MKAIKINLFNPGTQLVKSTREITRLFVHCTAGWQTETNEDLFKGFKAQGWNNPGYHVTVDADGTAWMLQSPNLIANGVASNNSKSLHISYKGGVAKSGAAKDKGKLLPVDNRTPAQKATLLIILKHWRSQYPKAKILGHRDISFDANKNGKVDSWERIKECPCFEAIPEYSAV